MTDVERLSRDELNVSRRELMAGTSVVAGAAVLGAMPRKVAAQQDPSNEISGTVTDSSGAVEDATVVAVPHDESLDPLVTTADANGEYLFDNGDLYEDSNLYHVIARDGTEADPRRGQENYPFIAATGGPTIPDSENLHARYDFTEEDGSMPVSDLSGNGHDLSGSYSGVGSSIDGNQAAEFDGTDDLIQSGQFSSISQPYMMYVVFSWGGSGETWVDLGSGDIVLARESGGEWSIYAGTNVTGGTSDQNDHYQTVKFDGSGSYANIDGSEVLSGDAGSGSMGEISLGARNDGSNHAQVAIGEVLVYDSDHDDSTVNDVENYLTSGWGF